MGRRLTIGSLLAGAPALAAALSASAAAAEHVEGWDVSNRDGVCTMLRPYDPARPMWLVVSRRADGRQFLRAHHPAWRVKRGEDLAVTLTFDGAPMVLAANGSITDGADPTGGFTAVTEQDWQARLATAQSVTITLPGAAPLAVDVAGLKAAMGALSRCGDANRAAGLPALQTLPQPRSALALTADDYPADARRERRAGRTTVRLAIDAAGVPQRCEVRQSSGSPDLDAQACRLAADRMRFDPAIAVDGRPASASYEFSVEWQL